MQITDQDHAKNVAAKYLKRYPHILVDETGNIHCLQTPEELAVVHGTKEVEGVKAWIVKGKLPENPTIAADEPK